MRATYTLNMWHHSHCMCHHTNCRVNMAPTFLVTSPSPYVWHRLHYTRHHILSFDLKPSFWGHHTHYIRYHVRCICVITPTLSMISQPLYVWYHIKYIWDILSTIFITSYPPCMTTQNCELITPHSSYVWHHLRYRRRHIYSITPSHSLYDFISTSGMTSQPLYQISHQLCLCHPTSPLISHPLLDDITPIISVTLYTLYITSFPMFISSHYCTYDSKSLTYETTSSMQFKIYTIPVTSQSLVSVITPNVLKVSHPNFVWHHTLQRYSIFCTTEDITSSLYEINPPFLWHHTHYIWHCINAISVTTSTLLMISHQIYLWDLILYICWHHIHCIQKLIHYIVPSQPLYLCLTHALSMISHSLYIWHCMHYMINIWYSI